VQQAAHLGGGENTRLDASKTLMTRVYYHFLQNFLQYYLQLSCPLSEVCQPPWIRDTIDRMRTTLLLIACIVLLSVGARESRAWVTYRTEHDYTFRLGEQRFGFADGIADGNLGSQFPWSKVYFGPLGERNVGFSAEAGLWIAGLVAVALVASLVVMVTWSSRKRALRGASNRRN
jgi:hypothetical protein